MPHIDVTMYPGRNDEIKQKLAQKLQLCVAEELNIDKSYVSVSIEDVNRDLWSAHMSGYASTMFVKPEA